jgi:hypothetical protein
VEGIFTALCHASQQNRTGRASGQRQHTCAVTRWQQSAAHNKSAVYPLISSGEAARIRENIEALAIDEPAFLKHYGVTSVAQLTTDKIASIDKAFAIKAKAKP